MAEFENRLNNTLHMSEELLETEDSLNLDETQDSNLETNEETVDQVRERLAKAEELARNQKIRAEKAEKALKAKAEVKEAPKESSYSLQDIRALGKVHDEDVERVEKFAKAEGLSIAEALKSEDLQAILERREQLRKTAEATNTGGSKRKSSPTTAEQIVSAAMEGKEVDPIKFAEAQMELRKKKK